ncbi:hypothetical protein M378DRAFT_720434 [Amanita muscaria Koide BX008]|uniref:Uncharacterized protein n=1 Tax=Amanita muscaria (strain Koide BX008) TaxID=946122 RepID=A0A0C2X6N9_AMAMK|nr:hypothetical protein M378DRAFT_720434 [Amanita muscaria Koide BX008]
MLQSVLNVHTPSTSFAIIHSLSEEDLVSLYDKLTRKVHSEYRGRRVGPGWLKYDFNGAIWNMDDDSDYTIFTWRQHQNVQDRSSSLTIPSSPHGRISPSPVITPSASTDDSSRTIDSPTLHLHDPSLPLPSLSEYQNSAYYVFRMRIARAGSPGRPTSLAKSKRSHGSGKSNNNHELDGTGSQPNDGVPAFKREFEKFHSENGVRTVVGNVGPVKNVRMLLKSGYRHVYMSRKFALKHKFIPPDAAPGYYGYSGLVSLGTWPITLTPASSAQSSISPSHPLSRPASLHPSTNQNGTGAKPTQPTTVMMPVYLAEEPHFDLVLGRSFIDRRQIRMNAVDPTDVVCLDTGEKIECELVILKDGRGEIVTVT